MSRPHLPPEGLGQHSGCAPMKGRQGPHLGAGPHAQEDQAGLRWRGHIACPRCKWRRVRREKELARPVRKVGHA
eukprot:1048686-Pyramimonas_sp.AAC.1